jgi:hypothetical protein
MLPACARRNSRQLGPRRRGAGFIRAWASSPRMLVGETRKPSLASSPQMRRRPQRGFSREPQHQFPHKPTTAAVRAGPGGCRHLRRTSVRRQRSVRGVTRRRPATSAADDKLRPSVAPDQPCGASVARIAGAGSRARDARPATRGLSHADHDGSEQVHRTQPAQRGRGRRKPSCRSSQPSGSAAATRILAPFTALGSARSRDARQ